jgi:hypothetical protein
MSALSIRIESKRMRCDCPKILTSISKNLVEGSEGQKEQPAVLSVHTARLEHALAVGEDVPLQSNTAELPAGQFSVADEVLVFRLTAILCSWISGLSELAKVLFPSRTESVGRLQRRP